jgi:hypothetical protein
MNKSDWYLIFAALIFVLGFWGLKITRAIENLNPTCICEVAAHNGEKE